jgi:hypothetical protein
VWRSFTQWKEARKLARSPVAGPVVIPACAEIKLKWHDGQKTFMNVLHGAHVSGASIPASDPETVFAAIKAAASTTTWLTHIAPAVTLIGVSIKNLAVANEPEMPSTGAAVAGTGVGQPLALSSALVVTLKTAKSGQAYRGRVYLGGMVAAALADAFNFTTQVGGDAVAFVTGVNGALTTAGYPLVVAQRALASGTHTDGSPWAARPAGTQPVTSVSIVNPRADTQRRRLGR